MKRVRIFAFGGLVVVVGLLTIFAIAKRSSPGGAEYKFASYGSIDQLANETDTLIEATVMGPGQTYYDNGGGPSDKNGDRLKLFPLKVINTYRGNVGQLDSLWVFQDDWDGNRSVPMKSGDHLIMFLQSFPPGTRVDLDAQFGKNSVFGLTGENASLFDVVNGYAIPREKSLVSLTASGIISREFKIDDLVAEARKATEPQTR